MRREGSAERERNKERILGVGRLGGRERHDPEDPDGTDTLEDDGGVGGARPRGLTVVRERG